MVLDEATSALDNITQKKVLDAVYAEEGTYDELIVRGGLFARLVEKQIL